MHLVLEIPDSEIPKNGFINFDLRYVDGKIHNAGGYDFTELPKGHGRLIDVDAIMKDYDTFTKSFVVNINFGVPFSAECVAPIVLMPERNCDE